MLGKILLTLGLCGIWLYALSLSGVSRFIKISLYTLIGAGSYFVWFPDQTTILANLIGIGRGADLIFYTWIVISFGVIINIHLKLRHDLNLITEIARHIAISRPYGKPDQLIKKNFDDSGDEKFS